MDIHFESFARLVYRLGHPAKLKDVEFGSVASPGEVFTSWLQHLPRPFRPTTGKHLFRLLFPQEGARRRYGMKETRLAYALERILDVKSLTNWDSAGGQGEGSGCLGLEVERMLRSRAGPSGYSALTLADVNLALDQLASHSIFSQLDAQLQNVPSQTAILTRLFRDAHLSAFALALLTQIILGDLRPLLNPLPTLQVRNPTTMLRLKSTAGPPQLDLVTAMKCWDEKMAELYLHGNGNVDWCADRIEALHGMNELHLNADVPPSGPIVGVNVQIPKCRKGRSVHDALDEFCSGKRGPPARVVWAETKYDGYRMQIHVQVRAENDIRITIFSKSKRNATIDRINTHSIVLGALGLPRHHRLPQDSTLRRRLDNVPLRSRVNREVILEAEVVPFNEGQREGGRGPGIEEFWCLGSAGVTSNEDELEAEIGDKADPNRHLCLAFFDVLHLDGQNLLCKTYDERRTILESLITPISGFTLIAERTRIPLNMGREAALQTLEAVFDRSNHLRQEGLVLKACDSTYLDSRWRWVKLKKDYIPNLGDCIDLVILGAGWDADRARELRVDTSVMTTFYIGVLTNSERVKARLETPHFSLLFRASYGFDRDALESVNNSIRHGRWQTKPYDRDDPFKKRLLGLSWTYRMPNGMRPPSLLFQQPICAEIMGAGFLKMPDRSGLYELRFPRIQKIYEPSERSWSEALTSRELVETAHIALSYNIASPTPNASPHDDSMRNLWRSASTGPLIDVPDYPTPSPERPSPRRMQSAPELLAIHKVSPTSPSTGRLCTRTRGISKREEKVVNHPITLSTTRCNSQQANEPDLGIPVKTSMTGPKVPSKVLAKRLASPLSSPTTKKRKHSPPMMTSVQLPIPPTSSPSKNPISLGITKSQELPPSSPIIAELSVNVPAPCSSPTEKARSNRTKHRALSLKSRIKIAVQAREIVPVVK